ncbi:non-specific lipid-transfer protein 5-like [Papaver somniferum]|uniref:non-specific lipid-transfer protein 5-like n=1 Tax=Papaver somniferum TaxID=3469 RepID=UPI000E6F5593|nr:non-specific lipid-transfer protein 5-like [Papaver somniferum]
MAAAFKLACVVLAFMVVAAPYAAEGTLSCDQVTGTVRPCLGYLLGGDLSPDCCPGVIDLHDMAETTADRQAACVCLKKAAMFFMTRIKKANAFALPGKCGVTIPYKFTPDFDCTKVK